MYKAFDAVCCRLALHGSEDRVTELVGEKIIELAVAGEKNAEKLTVRVLGRVRR